LNRQDLTPFYHSASLVYLSQGSGSVTLSALLEMGVKGQVGDVFITDMTHFEIIPPDSSHEPARRITEFFGSIVSVGSVSPADVLVHAALLCRRRPGRIRCPGHLQVQRDSVSSVIKWHCSYKIRTDQPFGESSVL
jgi:hypothetical protein